MSVLKENQTQFLESKNIYYIADTLLNIRCLNAQRALFSSTILSV